MCATEERRRSLPAAIGIGFITIYKHTLSPVLYLFGARCRHLPTCSDYGADALRRHGAWTGAWLALSRILRCHPLGSSGFDPVPDERNAPWWRIDKLGDWSWRARGD